MKKRCLWLNLNNPLYVKYHDEEWGTPNHDDRYFFEKIVLEGAQAGLSWETILNKRENYRKAFANFDPKKVARFDKNKIKTLMKNEGIVRNRLKIESAINNAKEFLKVQKEFGTFDKYVWKFVNNKTIKFTPKAKGEYPTRSPESDALAKDLKKRGFKFVGTTTMYAFMQATGLVNNHSKGCFRLKK